MTEKRHKMSVTEARETDKKVCDDKFPYFSTNTCDSNEYPQLMHKNI